MAGRSRELLIALVLLATGCRIVAPPEAPPGPGVALGQLVVTSDFPLPRRHRLLAELVDLRNLLAERLALEPSDEPIYVHLFARADALRAFLHARYPQFPERRALFVETDTRLSVYAHWGDHVAEDLRHEIAHGYLHSVVRNLPLWLDEGLAEFFEIPRARRGLNVAHVEMLSRRISDGWRPSLRQLEAIDSAGTMTQLDYAEAWAWVHYLLETDANHRRVLCEYLRSLDQEGRPESLALALRKLHLDYERRWVEHVETLAESQQER